MADGSRDGIPPGLTAGQERLFIEERDRMFALAYPGETIDMTENNLDYLGIEETSGLRSYAYYNQLEFWAELSTGFLAAADLTALREGSPKLYNLLREYYNRDDLPEAVIPAENDNPPARPEILPGWPTLPGRPTLPGGWPTLPVKPTFPLRPGNPYIDVEKPQKPWNVTPGQWTHKPADQWQKENA